MPRPCLPNRAGDDGLLPRFLRRGQYEAAHNAVYALPASLARNVFIEVTRTLTEGEHTLSCRLLELADRLGLPCVATNVVRHTVKMEFAAHETLRRIALHLEPDEESGELPLNGERFLKSQSAMAGLFADRPDVLENTVHLALRLAPPLDSTVRHLPRFTKLPYGESAFSYLSCLAWHGAKQRYGSNSQATTRLLHELEVIRDLGYCDYFLICKDVCDEARRRRSALLCAVPPWAARSRFVWICHPTTPLPGASRLSGSSLKPAKSRPILILISAMIAEIPSWTTHGRPTATIKWAASPTM